MWSRHCHRAGPWWASILHLCKQVRAEVHCENWYLVITLQLKVKRVLRDPARTGLNMPHKGVPQN